MPHVSADRQHQRLLFPTEPEPERLGSLRLPDESDDAFRARAQRAARIARVLVDACLANECVKQCIADGEPGFTAEKLRRCPIVRVEFDEAIAIGGLGETIDATRSKHWGDGPRVMPLRPDDWFFSGRIIYIYRENNRYNARFLQRKKLKELLGRRRPLVEQAKKRDKAMFLFELAPDDAKAIEERTGLTPAEFWQAARGRPVGELPRRERQPMLFDEPPERDAAAKPPLSSRLARLVGHYARHS